MVENTVKTQRNFWNSGATRPLCFRIEALKKLKSAIIDNMELLESALYSDLHKSTFESYTTEIGIVLSEIDYHISNLEHWLKPQKVHTPLFMQPASSRIVYQPLGVVLIIAPWNYPLQLTLNPLIGAISAGNCAILKPSPTSPASATAIEKIISENFAPQYISVLQGGGKVMEKLLVERFDFIFYTGGTSFGKTVMQAAARNLTPVILELGGKSPCIVDSGADLKLSARRIGWGKFLNAGQTCVAPDYILIHKDIRERFEKELQVAISRFFGSDPKDSPDYPRIIDSKNVQRLANMLDGVTCKIIFGGEYDEASCFFAPTAVNVYDTESSIMQNEIFGPILPIIEYENLQQAIDFINSRERPLALYFFGKHNSAKKVVENTSSGGVCINDTVMHLANRNLPFGGVGASGMGRYHGHDSFAAFSNRRSILSTSTLVDIPVRYAPYKWLSIVKRLL